MKPIRILGALFLLVLTLSFSGCSPTKAKEIPYGIWQSNNPDIVLYIDPDNKDGMFKGTYTIDGVENNLYLSLDIVQGAFVIHKESAYTPGKPGIYSGDKYLYFRGHWKLKDEELYFQVNSHFFELTGYSDIYFEKIDDYSTNNSSSSLRLT